MVKIYIVFVFSKSPPISVLSLSLKTDPKNKEGKQKVKV